MKNFWTERSINRAADKAGMRPAEWVSAKRVEFERRTGVTWSAYHGGGGHWFHPVDDGVSALNPGDRVLERLKASVSEMPTPAVTGYVTYLAVHEETGLPLKTIMEAARFLERDGEVRRTVQRMGKGYAFKLL